MASHRAAFFDHGPECGGQRAAEVLDGGFLGPLLCAGQHGGQASEDAHGARQGLDQGVNGIVADEAGIVTGAHDLVHGGLGLGHEPGRIAIGRRGRLGRGRRAHGRMPAKAASRVRSQTLSLERSVGPSRAVLDGAGRRIGEAGVQLVEGGHGDRQVGHLDNWVLGVGGQLVPGAVLADRGEVVTGRDAAVVEHENVPGGRQGGHGGAGDHQGIAGLVEDTEQGDIDAVLGHDLTQIEGPRPLEEGPLGAGPQVDDGGSGLSAGEDFALDPLHEGFAFAGGADGVVTVEAGERAVAGVAVEAGNGLARGQGAVEDIARYR